MALIIFDMDGTLVNSGIAIANTVNYVRGNLGFDILEKDYLLEKVNDPNINSSEFFYGTKEFTKEQITLFEEYYAKNCLKELFVYEGIYKLLDDLKSDFTLCVATNTHSKYAKRMLKHVEISKYFQTILGFDNVKKAKPHPEMINQLLDTHNIHKQKAQLIGDSKKDILSANAAGVDSVLVNWGFSNHKEDAVDNVEQLKKKIYNKFQNFI